MKEWVDSLSQKAKMPKIFENRLAVMRVRVNYIAPYRKCRYFYLEKKHLKNKRAFAAHVKEVASNWPNGTYYLKLSNGQVFSRFELVAGRVKKLYKESPATGKVYAIWDWIG